MATRPKLGMVLGGGGARGLAHVGVLQVMERLGVRPDVLVGVSMGAVVAGVYGARVDWLPALEAVDRSRLPMISGAQEDLALARMRGLVRNARSLVPSMWAWSRIGYEQFGRDTLTELYGEVHTFAETRLPVAMVATDLEAGQRVVFDDDSLIDATLASAAIPGVTRPVVVGEKVCVDGSFADPAPVDVARERGADVVVAVDVSQPRADTEFDNWAMTMLRGLEVTQRALNDERLRHADVVIRPTFAGRINLLDFSSVQAIVRAGVAATRAEVPAMQRMGIVNRAGDGPLP